MRFSPKRLGAVTLGTAVMAAGLFVGSAAASAVQPTSTALSAVPQTTISGQALNLKARVSFTKIKRTHLGGTVTFTATDKDGNPFELGCGKTDAPKVSPKGRAQCDVKAGTLLAGSAPYAVTASYSGDANDDVSSTTISVTPTVANTKIFLGVSPHPKNDTATVVTARLSAGKGTKGISTGNIQFFIVTTGSKVPLQCTNSTSPGHVTVPVTGNKAQCDLAAGWVHVPSGHNTAKWNIHATYFGNSSYTATFKPADRKGVVHA